MVFIFQLVCLLFLALAPAASQAANPTTFKPQVGIGTDFQAGTSYTPDRSTAMIGKYIRAIYKYAIGIVGILAAVVLMIGGVIWITAGGNAERIGEAKAWIASSLTGLLLALLSYTILATVNPALVDFQVSEVKRVEEITNGQTLCGNGQGLCYTVCPEDWTTINTQGECDYQRCCVRYAGACQTPQPNGLGGSCRTPSSEGGCPPGEKVAPNGYCGGDPGTAICCVIGQETNTYTTTNCCFFHNSMGIEICQTKNADILTENKCMTQPDQYPGSVGEFHSNAHCESGICIPN